MVVCLFRFAGRGHYRGLCRGAVDGQLYCRWCGGRGRENHRARGEDRQRPLIREAAAQEVPLEQSRGNMPIRTTTGIVQMTPLLGPWLSH